MKRFIQRVLLFSTPLLLYVFLAIYIDPYNIFSNETKHKLSELKSQISYKINYPLYKLNAFSDNPTDIIFLGDSRTDKIDISIVNSLSQKQASNLAYGGGTLPEIIETFWYASELHKLKEVYIGVNFNLYNKTNNMNRVSEAIGLKKSLFSYIFSSYCSKSTFLILKSLITNQKIEIEKPNLNKEEFWKYQLETSASNFYKDYQYPIEYLNQLTEISKYCKENDIKLVFFIPPSHMDLQQRVTDYNLERQELQFKEDISSLGKCFDFDYPNILTENKNNFTDPFHFNDSIANLIVEEIILEQTNYAKRNK